MKLIDKDAVVAKIIELDGLNCLEAPTISHNEDYKCGYSQAMEEVRDYLDTLEVKKVGVDFGDPKGDKSAKCIIDTKKIEVKEVCLEKLGEIARHLIAVKEHIEDMRLDKEEWFMLEKIGYPERFKTQKGEKI